MYEGVEYQTAGLRRAADNEMTDWSVHARARLVPLGAILLELK